MKSPPYVCIHEKCPLYPAEYLERGGSMIGGCEYYPGYGYCENKNYGIPVSGTPDSGPGQSRYEILKQTVKA